MRKSAAAAALCALGLLAGCAREETPGEKLDHMNKSLQEAAGDAAKELGK
jgi:hypothetical protein